MTGQYKREQHNFFVVDKHALVKSIGKERLIESLKRMLLIRNFEIRAESAYQQGLVGGFFHAYIGQEAIQTSAVEVMGKKNWWATSYRCHALALLLGETPNSLMAELYGRSTGNAKGRGGSMHFFSDRLLGGFGIVGGQVPIATGAAFNIKYRGIKDEVAVCFMGEGAVAQGAFHEALNIASLWDLPIIYVIENNYWGMGTSVKRAISVETIAENKAPGYDMKAYTVNGMDFFNCWGAFEHIYNEVITTSRPVLVEVITERFRGHSISDPGLYRSKEELKECMLKDPIQQMLRELMQHEIIDEEAFKEFDKQQRELVLKAMEYAEKSPWPDVVTLEDDVFAP